MQREALDRIRRQSEMGVSCEWRPIDFRKELEKANIFLPEHVRSLTLTLLLYLPILIVSFCIALWSKMICWSYISSMNRFSLLPSLPPRLLLLLWLVWHILSTLWRYISFSPFHFILKYSPLLVLGRAVSAFGPPSPWKVSFILSLLYTLIFPLDQFEKDLL